MTLRFNTEMWGMEVHLFWRFLCAMTLLIACLAGQANANGDNQQEQRWDTSLTISTRLMKEIAQLKGGSETGSLSEIIGLLAQPFPAQEVVRWDAVGDITIAEQNALRRGWLEAKGGDSGAFSDNNHPCTISCV